MASRFDVSIAMPGLRLRAPDPLARALGGSETAGLQLAGELFARGAAADPGAA